MKANKKNLYKDVEFLTSMNPARNYQQLQALNKAANYISDAFRELGNAEEDQVFKVNGENYRNIRLLYGKEEQERVVVGAHYDVCGDQPGADDNASGVAGLLETARLLFSARPKLPYAVEFVAYSLEEPPYFATDNMGSAVHAKYLHEQGVKVKYMICFEMIGYFSDEPNSQRFPDEAMRQFYPNTGNFIVVVGKQGQEAFTRNMQHLMQQHTTIDVQSVNLPIGMGLAGLSDHRNYWRYNVEAIMINDSSFLRNPHYHQKSDTIDTLDFDRMTAVVDGVYGALINL
ncbi:M28 family peptidase [Pontibacter sp. 13R65]|uniref:M28 family peptidase n=1 Tax=Pontibacter sp. 13R65 TaxID=3127458 RepID=UPI00301E4A97